MRVAYLGPPGTVSHEALRASDTGAGRTIPLPAGAACEPLPVATVYDAVMAVHDGEAERAIVPIENSVEGTINPTLDTLAIDADDVGIVGELVHTVHLCLIARPGVRAEEVVTVVSHPQPLAQCARFLRRELPGAAILAAASTAEAVRRVAEQAQPWAALGTGLAAELHGATVLRSGVEDEDVNQTRFVWLAPADTPTAAPAGAEWKTSIVFWGAGDTVSGWLVRCLSEFADRDVNLTLIESRPRRRQLGHYMFFADLTGRASDAGVAGGLAALGRQAEMVRVLGSYPAA